MCIIAAKPKGVDMPNYTQLWNMWNRNPDGAGLMYAVNGKVHIEKGFMDRDRYMDRLDELEELYDLKELPMVMHFRITTHGGTKPENCHPFPISDSLGMLKKLKLTTRVGVAHNGIIPITPRKDISDTMEYVASQLAPLSRAVPEFYKDKNLMQMIKNATESKLAFLTNKGDIYTVGKFIEHNGIMYSNTSYEHGWSWRDYDYTKWEYGGGWQTQTALEPYYNEIEIMWLDETKGEYVSDDMGGMYVGEFGIDKYGIVFEYDDAYDVFRADYDLKACTGDGMALRFNKDSKMVSTELATY